MTPGHRHRTLKVNPDGMALRILTRPLITLGREHLERVEASPYPYGVLIEGQRLRGNRLSHLPDPREVYVLTALGILHRWTGLTLEPRS